MWVNKGNIAKMPYTAHRVYNICGGPHWDRLVASVFASHAIGRGFAPRPVCIIPKTIIKMVQTASLLFTQALDRSLAVQPDCVKGQVVCGTFNGLHAL